jgi:hypothetical protein
MLQSAYNHVTLILSNEYLMSAGAHDTDEYFYSIFADAGKEANHPAARHALLKR